MLVNLNRHLLSRNTGIGIVVTPGKPVFISHYHITAWLASPRHHALLTQLLEPLMASPGI
jgi:hypothetical protein